MNTASGLTARPQTETNTMPGRPGLKIMTIDITRFCATTRDPRKDIHTPFRCPGGIVATNGEILICMNDDGGEYQDATEQTKGYAARFKAYINDPKREWVDAASITLPDALPCPDCNSKGHTFEDECDECDGDGEFRHGSHWYECEECNGSGKVAATTCSRCKGSGEDFQPIHVGNTAFQRKYLALIVGLPDCRLGLPVTPLKTTVFTFTGGFGAIMPVRV